MKLWYNDYAKEWIEALPLGNGHLGAMAYGGTIGLFDLSENTCWSGHSQSQYINNGANESMIKARESLINGKIAEAEGYLENCKGIKESYGTQVPLGRLYVGAEKECKKTYRELDLLNGVCTDKLFYDEGYVKRESFISNPNKVMCVRLTTDLDQLPDLRIWLEGASQPTKTNIYENNLKVAGKALENIHSSGVDGVDYFIKANIDTDGEITWSRRGLIIKKARKLIIKTVACTNMFFNKAESVCDEMLNKVLSKSYKELREKHVEEHSRWMSNCTLTLSDNKNSNLPTDERISKFVDDSTDYSLITLFFQYGRYLILNSSRPDSVLPAALQGVWNDDRACRMEWTDDMHLDINTQMNYYPVHVTGLSECIQPLLKWIKDILMPNGTKIAKELYGADGWVAHTVSNAYGWAAPGWDVSWGFGITCGSWVTMFIWEHYLYTKDVDFLEQYYNVLYESAKFLDSILLEDPITKELLITPSYSPENFYNYQGGNHSITAGSTFDTSVTKYIFSAIIKASEILGKNDNWINTLKDRIKMLPDYKVGKYGQLMEWHKDYEETFPDHRHSSHLLSLHPLNLINPEKQPKLKKAVVKTLERRLGGNSKDIIFANWAGALLILYSARLKDNEAGVYVNRMISYLSRKNMMITHQGETSMITGGIYELDGNTGFTAGVAEMLLQSYSGKIDLLPALPKEWKEGNFKGLVCYGGHKVDASWNNEKIEVSLKANQNEEIVIIYHNKEKKINAKKDERYTICFNI